MIKFSASAFAFDVIESTLKFWANNINNRQKHFCHKRTTSPSPQHSQKSSWTIKPLRENL